MRSVMVLAGGTAIAQAITLLSLPFITRFYSPDDFSVLAVYVAVVQVISVAACLRYELAIPMPSKDEDAVNILALALSLVCIVASTVAVVIAVFGDELGRLGNSKMFGNYVWLVPIGILFTGAYTAFQFWAIREKQFQVIAKTRLSQSIAAALVQLSMGVAKMAPLGLILGHVVQSGAGVLRLIKSAFANNRQLMTAVNRRKMRAVGREYRQFPKYSVAEALSQTSGIQVPIIIIATLPIGPEAGFLMLAMRAMQAPISLIASAVSQVFASAAPEAHRSNSLGDLTTRTIGGLLKAVAGPTIFVGILAPQFFILVFGADWQRAGELVQWLTPLFIVQSMASSVGTTLYITKNQRLALIVQASGAIIRIGSVVVAAGWATGWVSEIYALSGFFFYMIYLYAGIRCTDADIQTLWIEIATASRIIFLWVVAAIAVVFLMGFF